MPLSAPVHLFVGFVWCFHFETKQNEHRSKQNNAHRNTPSINPRPDAELVGGVVAETEPVASSDGNEFATTDTGCLSVVAFASVVVCPSVAVLSFSFSPSVWEEAEGEERGEAEIESEETEVESVEADVVVLVAVVVSDAVSVLVVVVAVVVCACVCAVVVEVTGAESSLVVVLVVVLVVGLSLCVVPSAVAFNTGITEGLVNAAMVTSSASFDLGSCPLPLGE